MTNNNASNFSAVDSLVWINAVLNDKILNLAEQSHVLNEQVLQTLKNIECLLKDIKEKGGD